MTVAINYEIAGGGSGSSTSTSSGGGFGGGGSDRTAVTVEADDVNGGQRVQIETLDGIPHTYSYDVTGQLVDDEWVAGGLLREVEYSSVPGFGIASGNRYVNGGQIYVPSAEMPALKVGLIALGAVVVPAQFWVPEYHCAFVWDEVDQRFRPASGGEVSLFVDLTQPTRASPAAAETTAIFTATLPGWLRGKGGVFRTLVFYDLPNSGISKTVKTKINGTISNESTASASQIASTVESTVYCESDTDVVRMGNLAGQWSAGVVSSTQAIVDSTYTADANLTITSHVQYASDPGAITITGRRFELLYR